MAAPRIGYLLPTRDWTILGGDVAALAEQARAAEDLGFDSVWAGDSPVTRPRADPLLVLAAAAARTSSVTLGTAVLLPALRHPVLLAHQLATLDAMSGGRVIAGMGSGFANPATRAQFEALNVDFGTRVSRMEETLAAMRLLWSGRGVSFAGRHFAFSDVSIAPRPVREGGPPVWLAGGGARALRRVARLADGWLPYPPTHRQYADERALLAGSPVTPALYATLCLDDDPERARARLRVSIERYYDAPLEFVEGIQAMFAGTPDGAAAWLRGYADAGAEHVVVRLAVDDHRSAMEEFAGLVLPALRPFRQEVRV